jgi:glycosyltransferase involved in cell wall biosynthesis
MLLVLVTGSFPTRARPGSGAFIRQFALSLARQGHECVVVNPTSIFDRRYGQLPPREDSEDVAAHRVVVLRPRFVSFSVKRFGPFNTALLTQRAFDRAVWRALSPLGLRPHAIYGHFLYQGGRAAVVTGRRLVVPSVVGVGEGKFWSIEPFGRARAAQELSGATAFLAVSTPIKNALIEQIGVPAAKIRVFPNGVDRSLFFPRDRMQMCRKLGLPGDTFNICFVGCFDGLKGGARLLQATANLPAARLIFVGEGPLDFSGPQIVFKGTVEQSLVPEYLSASDLFVLPTAEEGSCNALIEAMACGAPIVTSNGDYTSDIVDDHVAIRVDPYDVNAVREAIVVLMNDPNRRVVMRRACLERAAAFDIDERARHVAAWIASLGSNRGDEAVA